MDAVREAFCYLGRLTMADGFEELLKLVPREEQALLSVIWADIKDISDEDVRERFIRLREMEPKANE